MTNIEQTLAEIRRRDNMYPDVELTPGAVADRRTLLNIIRQLEIELTSLAKSCEMRAGSSRISGSEEEALEWVALEIRKAFHPDDYREDVS